MFVYNLQELIQFLNLILIQIDNYSKEHLCNRDVIGIIFTTKGKD